MTHVVDADGGKCAEDGRDGCGNKCDEHGVVDGVVERLACFSHQQVAVEVGREARPCTQHLGFGEREDKDEQDGSIEQQHQDPDICVGKDFLH